MRDHANDLVASAQTSTHRVEEPRVVECERAESSKVLGEAEVVNIESAIRAKQTQHADQLPARDQWEKQRRPRINGADTGHVRRSRARLSDSVCCIGLQQNRLPGAENLRQRMARWGFSHSSTG